MNQTTTDLAGVEGTRAALAELVAEAEQLRGHVDRRPVGTLDELAVHRFGVTTRLLAAAEAAPHGRRTAAAHLYLNAVRGWGAGPELDALREDGAEGHSVGLLPAPGIRLMGAGQKLTFHADLEPDAVLHCEVSLESADLKDGASGPLGIFRWRNRYVADDGTLVAECLETVIAR